MPNYKGHLCGGFIVYGFILFMCAGMLRPSFITGCEWLLFTLAGSLFPDIDIKSKGQKYFYYVIFILLLILAINKQLATIACCSFIIITPMLVRHRGIFHQGWFIISLPIAVWGLTCLFLPLCSASFFYNTLFFIVGGLSHIFLDCGFNRMMSHLMRDRNRKGWGRR